MKIAYFSNQFAWTSGHGIAHYTHRLYDGLTVLPDLTIIPVATWGKCTVLERQMLQLETGLKLLPWGRRLTPLAWILFNAPPIEHWLQETIDVTHILSLGFPVATRKKLVVTVHDIGPLTHTRYFTKSKPRLFRHSFSHMVRYADAIICVSQSTADAVLEYSKAPLSDRIHVIREGVDGDFFAKKPLDPYTILPSLPPRDIPFLMAAGALSPRKNIRRVLEAFLSIQDTIPHHLVLVGGAGWDSDEVLQMLQDPGVAAKVHQLGYVTDNQLQALYKHADFYIHPSLFEGFGLTVLEAMASGCPVITSNLSSLPEVAGDAALLVNPFSVEEIAEAIEQFALNNALRTEFAKRGLERAQQFKWTDTAEGVAAVYRSL